MEWLAERGESPVHYAEGGATHESAHAAAAAVLGAVPMALVLDHHGQGFASSDFDGVDHQLYLVMLAIGTNAHQRYLRSKGHGADAWLVRNAVGAAFGDFERIRTHGAGHPGSVTDPDRAVADADRLLRNRSFRTLVKDVADHLLYAGDMTGTDLARVMAPHRPGTLLRREGIEVWAPGTPENRYPPFPADLARLSAPELLVTARRAGNMSPEPRTGPPPYVPPRPLPLGPVPGGSAVPIGTALAARPSGRGTAAARTAARGTQSAPRRGSGR